MAGFDEVRDVSSSYFTLEELAGLRPDLLFAGWNYGRQMGTSRSSAGLAKYGIKTGRACRCWVALFAGCPSSA